MKREAGLFLSGCNLTLSSSLFRVPASFKHYHGIKEYDRKLGNPSSNNSGRGNGSGYTIQTLKATRKEVTPLSCRYGHLQT